MFSQKIIDILNQDAEAKEFNQLFESKMIEHNLTEGEKDKALQSNLSNDNSKGYIIT